MFEDADELELPEGLLIRTDGRVDKDAIIDYFTTNKFEMDALLYEVKTFSN